MEDLTDYYENYYGHLLPDLTLVHNRLRNNGTEVMFFLAGDSTLDNKHWLKDQRVPVARNYSGLMEKSVPDVCYWFNHLLQGTNAGAINCAVEESTLGERRTSLLAHDIFIRDNLRIKDVLIISVGGNDIALKPSAGTVVNMTSLILLPLSVIRWNPSYTYFVNLFREGFKSYIGQLTTKCQPRQVIISGTYYPCLHGSGWADRILGLLGYNNNPLKLQTIIRMIFTDAITNLGLPMDVRYAPLYEVLDANDPSDYVARVEPSSIGGKKMAKYYLKVYSQT